jgi:hypothetical protein
MPAVASMMRAFRACPTPRVGLPRRFDANRISLRFNGQNSLLAGKNAGNFVDSAAFCKYLCRKHLRIQRFVDEFPTHGAGNIFERAGNSIRPAGNWREIDPRAPRIQSSQNAYQSWIDYQSSSKQVIGFMRSGRFLEAIALATAASTRRPGRSQLPGSWRFANGFITKSSTKEPT